MVYRVYVEKKPGLDNEARGLLKDVREFLGIQGLEKVRLLNRYDAEDMDPELFETAVREVFSEPQLDNTCRELEEVESTGGERPDAVFAVEYLPGQFDQRADSAAQCIQILSQGERPLIRSARVYLLYGKLSEAEIAEIRKYVINPVEPRDSPR
ncbi:MAG: phosphoribosylformylglycinamidine synthase, partial [Clostridia bacterium]|nr:phosphoribosylformylglycinamidine synthase [Clostridia bacterium]